MCSECVCTLCTCVGKTNTCRIAIKQTSWNTSWHNMLNGLIKSCTFIQCLSLNINTHLWTTDMCDRSMQSSVCKPLHTHGVTTEKHLNKQIMKTKKRNTLRAHLEAIKSAYSIRTEACPSSAVVWYPHLYLAHNGNRPRCQHTVSLTTIWVWTHTDLHHTLYCMMHTYWKQFPHTDLKQVHALKGRNIPTILKCARMHS